jgi:protein-disulfide isomerase
VPQIDRDYIKTGKVKYVVRDFPLTRIHPQAFKGHEAARCAGDQDKFWEMHGRLFAGQSAMTPSDLESHAQALGIDLSKFRDCLTNGKHAAGIQQDVEEGEKAGITGTPTFMLGPTDLKEARLRVSRTLTGAQPYERFKDAIEAVLEQTSSRPK